MNRVASCLVVLCATFVSACASNNSSPTTPTPTPTPPATTPTVTGLSVDGLDAIRSGFFAPYVATARLSNGTTQVVTPTWSSDNTSVATVATNGDVTGQSNGTATIQAIYQGVSTAKAVRIVANFGGAWTGSYRITKCDQSGAFATARWCQGLGGVGAILPVGLALTQGGTSRDQISGTVSLGSLAGSISGNVTGDGRLILGGTFPVNNSGVTFSFTFGGWETRLSGPTGMTGQWAHSLAAIGSVGNAYQENQLVTMTHTSNAAQPAIVPAFYAMSIEQFAQSLRH